MITRQCVVTVVMVGMRWQSSDTQRTQTLHLLGQATSLLNNKPYLCSY